MSRLAFVLTFSAVLAGAASPGEALAQNAESNSDRKVQDLITAQARQIDLTPAACRPESRVPGEIVVCADQRKNERERLPLRDELDSAKSTSGGVPATPDVHGIRQIPGGISIKGCFLPPCPPPPMYFFDIASLPEAPEGSDADLVARGEMRAD